MKRLCVLLLFLRLALLSACSNPNNLLIGSAPSGATWPVVSFDDLRSVIGGQATLYDDAGNTTGQTAWVVILSDQPNLCDTVTANRNYFRQAPAANLALLLFVPAGRLGTFVVDRPGDEGTFAELTAAGGAQTVTPFNSVGNGSYINLTDFENGGAATGSYDMFLEDPPGLHLYEFGGQFQASACPTLDGTLLP